MFFLEARGRVACKIPRWLALGFKIYYLHVRPNFMPLKGLDKIRRLPTVDETNIVVTEQFFINSKGTHSFRVKGIVDQICSQVCQKHVAFI